MVVAVLVDHGRISDTQVLTLYWPVYSVCRSCVYHLRTIDTPRLLRRYIVQQEKIPGLGVTERPIGVTALRK